MRSRILAEIRLCVGELQNKFFHACEAGNGNRATGKDPHHMADALKVILNLLYTLGDPRTNENSPYAAPGYFSAGVYPSDMASEDARFGAVEHGVRRVADLDIGRDDAADYADEHFDDSMYGAIVGHNGGSLQQKEGM